MDIPPLRIHFSESDIQKINKDIKAVLKSGQLSLGQMTKRFEKEFAYKMNTKFAVAVNSGTTALEILLRIYKIQGKNVIVPTNTNYATAAAVVFAGGKLKLADSGIFLSLENIKKKVDKNTAGIIIVHIGGYLSAELKNIKHFCDEKGLFLIEDAAHAHGSYMNNQAAGSFGHAAAFSFFPTKVITSGEGGMIVTNDEKIYQQILIYRDQGKDPGNNKKNILMGNSWRMSEAQAVIGYYQLMHLEEYVNKRNSIIKKYSEALKKYPKIKIFTASAEMRPSGYKFIIQLPSAKICQKIKQELETIYNIHVGGGVYDFPIHQQPIFKHIVKKSKYPEADHFCSTHLCLPIWSTMKNQEVEYVIKSLEKCLSKISS